METDLLFRGSSLPNPLRQQICQPRGAAQIRAYTELYVRVEFAACIQQIRKILGNMRPGMEEIGDSQNSGGPFCHAGFDSLRNVRRIALQKAHLDNGKYPTLPDDLH